MSLLEPVALLALVFWLGLLLDRPRRWPGECRLPAQAPPLRDLEAARVVAVVPARDEAAVLPETLPALLAQDLPGLRVVLVDDGSTDGTAALARRLGAAAGERLRVVAAPATPAGWSGKVHAQAQGVDVADELLAVRQNRAGGAPVGGDPLPGVASGRAVPVAPPRRIEADDWYLFTDADIRHRPGALRALLAVAGGEGPGDGRYDFVSVMARLHASGLWEKLLIPPFVFFFQLLYPFRRVASAGSRVAAAAGGCMLVRRAALEAAGGLASIRGEVIDDVALARRVASAGERLWLGLDDGIVSVRPYRGLGEIWRMVARSAFVQLRRRLDLLLLVLAGLVVCVVSPPFVLLAAGAKLATGGVAPAGWLGEPAARAALWSGAAWLLQAAALLPAVRHHRVAAWWALGLPFAGALYALMTASSARDHYSGRGARWKGRAYGAAAEEAGDG